MSEVFDINALFDRIANLEKAALLALSTPVSSDAVDFFFYRQNGYPYWKNRLGDIPIGTDSEDYDEYTIDVIMRLVLGHMTQGYEGEPENQLQLWIPQVIAYINSRELLIDDTYPTQIKHLESARIVRCTGFRAFQDGGIGASDVGTEFTLRCTVELPIIQVYE